MTAQAISSVDFIKALAAKGIVADKEVHRVVIDAKCGEVVKIYVQHFGTEEILDLVTAFDLSDEGIEVMVIEP